MPDEGAGKKLLEQWLPGTDAEKCDYRKYHAE